ncbi:MAG: hypothetical protein CGU29_16585 [Candidatus Dactylopiibacterium carminicum]|uniref:KfrA N-terminal DNA-binding domain-containing protein n=1 Tax=Candidatus Dactylopiibacterium carminicum TaxID=857335 RepID=A0A272EP27_9RHOO|nr:DNA-binding protein [Candidatus Dactylopiibacterium carminicum]KAF7597814.1 hypothetical protein BGI27_16680 [Candidatus Dactylopiibacterium carminicum]PAS91420.1 MAG: hypothetical protein CGU29_16585 [Candidatus Dactylopiibacterium carminicum]PAS95640.1 MAG: hypothetical protein BSR46_16710 [Candidatus Dactylopiibacterium carminicum]
MSAQEVTYEEVAAAAVRMVEGGQPVTVGALHDALGVASLQALHRHLAAWRASQTPAAEASMAIPEAVTTALMSWAQQLAESARSGLRSGLEQADGDLASLLALNEQLEGGQSELRAQLEQLTQVRDQALAKLAERDEQINRLTVELRHARDVATEALVGKAKDQLAIDGKDAQITELRRQLEQNLAASAAQSDARLAIEMELVGATTARDNLASEVKALRAELDAQRI